MISFDEMWAYVGGRRPGKRREAWIWTALVEERDGRRWGCFEVRDRSEAIFLRLYEQLPEAELYRSGDYRKSISYCKCGSSSSEISCKYSNLAGNSLGKFKLASPM